MPAVFVHGNPETAAVWDELRSRLARSDHVALSLPGFGCQRPPGFGASKDEYADWLAGELQSLGEPVDLVGHDWGGFLVARVARLRGELVRSWASDALTDFDERSSWHRYARVWQTPREGESWVERALATPITERAAAFERLGMPRDAAPTVAGWLDAPMGEAMLALYRSAVDLATDWAGTMEGIRAPGLALFATADRFANEELFRAAAERAGARTVELDGLGHWWMLEDPRRGAGLLEDFWASLDSDR